MTGRTIPNGVAPWFSGRFRSKRRGQGHRISGCQVQRPLGDKTTADMLYQLAIYALSKNNGVPRSTILYPTLIAEAVDQIVLLKDPIFGHKRAEIALRPVNLLKLEELIRPRQGAGSCEEEATVRSQTRIRQQSRGPVQERFQALRARCQTRFARGTATSLCSFASLHYCLIPKDIHFQAYSSLPSVLSLPILRTIWDQ